MTKLKPSLMEDNESPTMEDILNVVCDINSMYHTLAFVQHDMNESFPVCSMFSNECQTVIEVLGYSVWNDVDDMRDYIDHEDDEGWQTSQKVELKDFIWRELEVLVNGLNKLMAFKGES